MYNVDLQESAWDTGAQEISNRTDIKSTGSEKSDSNVKTVGNRVKTLMLSRNINVLGRRTSIRLEKEMWEALKSIAGREECSVHDICSMVELRKRRNTSLTAAIRVFVMLYYKAATTEEGHRLAGHGSFDRMKRRAGITGDISGLQPSGQNDLERFKQDAEKKRRVCI